MKQPSARRLLRNMRRTRELEKLVQANVKKVEWTLEDPTWRPTRDYLEKMLAAYKAHTAELLGMLGAPQ
jgi:hypothetical protein